MRKLLFILLLIFPFHGAVGQIIKFNECSLIQNADWTLISHLIVDTKKKTVRFEANNSLGAQYSASLKIKSINNNGTITTEQILMKNFFDDMNTITGNKQVDEILMANTYGKLVLNPEDGTYLMEGFVPYNQSKKVRKIIKKQFGVESGKLTTDRNTCVGVKIFKKEEETQVAKKTPKPNESKKKTKQENEGDKELLEIGSGTGFFIDSNGYAITNHHVVEHCLYMATTINGNDFEGKTIAIDRWEGGNDLALIKFDYKNSDYAKFNRPNEGDDIIVMGYPLAPDLGRTSIKGTRGIISSMTGYKGTSSQIQIDAAISGGNSGGPIYNYYGNVVGVAVAGLEGKQIQSINFGIKSDTVIQFLNANDVSVSITSKNFSKLENKDIFKIAKKSTLQLNCINTLAVHKKLIKSKTNVSNLYENPRPFQ